MNVIPARGPSRPRLRSVRLVGATLAAAALLAGSLATAPAAVASPLLPTFVSSPPPGITIAPPTGTGVDSSNPFVYVIELDCAVINTSTFSNSTFAFAEEGKFYRFQVDIRTLQPSGRICLLDTYENTSSGSIPPYPTATGFLPDINVEFTPALTSWNLNLSFTEGQLSASHTVSLSRRPMAPPPRGGGGGVAPDPTAAAVATAVAQSTAAGVEGTSSAVMVRNGQVVPVTSTLSSSAGPRGGVVLETEGLTVTVASPVGARAGSGVVVPSGGEMECALCGAFAPGSVVEAWINSDPRLTAAVLIPEDAEDGDCHQLAIPTGAPLDGGGAIEEGAHTLQLRMYTDSGFAVLSTGITIGSVSPSRIPAGEGSAPLSGPLGAALILLVGAGGLGLVAARREAVRD